MGCFRRGVIKAEDAAEELEISARRFRQLYGEYLEACAHGSSAQWTPGRSGGGHRRTIPREVAELWRKLLGAKPPAPYGFAASEALRLHDVVVDRALVRRWAMEHGLAHPAGPRPEPAAVRRWQCEQVGALWQLDASPHRWFGSDEDLVPLLDMVDDCSRLITGTRLYPKECIMAYLDFLPRAFERYGLPVALYVDYHSFFFTHIPENLTYLAETLRLCDISLRYASTAQAKGKIERQHLFWQNRLPSYFAAEGIHDTVRGNEHIEPLREHHNHRELHRELQMTPQTAWDRAVQEGRSVLRPFRPDPWWPYIWSVRSAVKVGIDGKVPAGRLRLPVHAHLGARLWHCQHADGSISILANSPGEGGRPVVLCRAEHVNPPWYV